MKEPIAKLIDYTSTKMSPKGKILLTLVVTALLLGSIVIVAVVLGLLLDSNVGSQAQPGVSF